MVCSDERSIEGKCLYLERADEERREKEAHLKLKKKNFRDLLKDSNVSTK